MNNILGKPEYMVELMQEKISRLEAENARLRKKGCACEFDEEGNVNELCKAHGDFIRQEKECVMDREEVMKKWDYIRDAIEHYFGASEPRDIFESIIDGYDEKIEALEAKNIRLKSKKTELAELLGIIFDKYETGESCYDSPDDPGGVYIGNAVRLNDDTFHKIVAALAQVKEEQWKFIL